MARCGELRPFAGELRDVAIPYHPQPVATDQIRRHRLRVRTVGGETYPEPGEEDPTEELSRTFDVASALWRLSPTHREVIVLAYFQGLSQSEISRQTDTPLGTVKSRTTAALRALRESMLQVGNRWSPDE